MVDVGVTIYLVLFGLILFFAIGLFSYGFIIKPFCKGEDNKNSEGKECFCVPRKICSDFVFWFCSAFYILAAIFVFSGLISYLINGFTHSATDAMRDGLTYCYAFSLFLMLYVWILRMYTFDNSAYQYKTDHIRWIKVLFWTLLILGMIVVWLFIQADGEEGTTLTTITTIASLILGIVLFSLLGWIIYSFIARLKQLRGIAEDTILLSKDGDIDIQNLESIQKLVKLQLKLTIASVTAILSSVFAIPLAIVNDGHPEFMIYGPDCIIGFICMYCTIKSNTEFYEKICKLCIICCGRCCCTADVDEQIGHHIEVHSRSLQTMTNAKSNTSAGSSGGSGGSSGNNPTIIKPVSTTSMEQATPRPSGAHRADESMPVDSITMQNQQSEMTSNDKSMVTTTEMTANGSEIVYDQ